MTISIFSFQLEQICITKATGEKLPFETRNVLDSGATKDVAAPAEKLIKATSGLDWKIFLDAIVRFNYLSSLKF
jgi:hypothetical protein